MRGKSRAMAAAAITSIALLAAACGGAEAPPAPQSGGQAGGDIIDPRLHAAEPADPGNTSEVCGGNVLDAIMAKLVHYNADTAAPELDIAESIETNDNQNFTVKLKTGYKFHDGTEVKAKNFVDAWN